MRDVLSSLLICRPTVTRKKDIQLLILQRGRIVATNHCHLCLSLQNPPKRSITSRGLIFLQNPQGSWSDIGDALEEPEPLLGRLPSGDRRRLVSSEASSHYNLMSNSHVVSHPRRRGSSAVTSFASYSYVLGLAREPRHRNLSSLPLFHSLRLSIVNYYSHEHSKQD